MTEDEKIELQMRLKNCLQTILELEPDLEKLDLGHVLLKEYSLLRSFIEKLDDVNLFEEDVNRIEQATANFLDELKTPLSLLHDSAVKRRLTQ